MCDLKVFSLQSIPAAEPGLNDEQLIEFMRSLHRHRNLRTLALRAPRETEAIGGRMTAFQSDNNLLDFPQLEVLYLGGWDRHWAGRLSGLKFLRILKVKYMKSGEADEAFRAIRNYRHLETLTVSLVRSYSGLVNMERLIEFALSCSELRRLDVTMGNVAVVSSGSLSENQLTLILRSLPYLQLLSIDYKGRMSSTGLRRISELGPKLVVLHLPRVKFYLSQADLAATAPFHHLEWLEVERILFAHIQRLDEPAALHQLATVWKQAFPHIRHVPCTEDNIIWDRKPQETLPLDDSSLHQGLRRDGIESADEHTIIAEDLKNQTLGLIGSVSWYLRGRLWNRLGYRRDKHAICRIRHFWQSQYETKTIGWPALTLDMYRDPDKYKSIE